MPKRKPKSNSSSELPALTDSQLEIMQIIWSHEETTVTDVWHELRKEREVARNTVLTVMDRLEKRGWLSKKSIGKTHHYSAAVNQKKTLMQVVRKMVDTAFSGSVDEMIVALLDGRGVSDAEADRIKKLIKDKRQKDQSKKKRS